MVVTFLATSFLASAQGKADDIVGTYQTEGGKARVTISKQGTKYIGTLIWTRRGDILDSKNPDKSEAQKKLTGKVICETWLLMKMTSTRAVRFMTQRVARHIAVRLHANAMVTSR